MHNSALNKLCRTFFRMLITSSVWVVFFFPHHPPLASEKIFLSLYTCSTSSQVMSTQPMLAIARGSTRTLVAVGRWEWSAGNGVSTPGQVLE